MIRSKGVIKRLLLYIQTLPVRVQAKSGTHLEDIQQQAKGIGKDLSGRGQINPHKPPNKAVQPTGAAWAFGGTMSRPVGPAPGSAPPPDLGRSISTLKLKDPCGPSAESYLANFTADLREAARVVAGFDEIGLHQIARITLQAISQ